VKYFIFLMIGAAVLSAHPQDEVALLKWVGPEGSHPGTYEEWIKTNPVTPFYAALDRFAPGDGRQGTVAILTQQSIAGALAPSLNQLTNNLQSEGFTILSYQVSGGTPDSLRGFLRNLYNTSGIEGAFFVGNLPICWFEILNDFNTYGYAQFPCDLFYMDLDGTWLDTMTTGNGKYDGHVGAIEPEIYIGRLTPTGIGTDTTVLKNYFRKDNAFRRDTLFLNPQALVFVDNDWIPYGPQWAQDVGLLYPDTLNYWDAETTRATIYRAKISTPRSWVSVFVHSSSALHQFVYNNGNSYDYYYSSEYGSQDPPVNFWNHFACSFSRYTDNGYGGGQSIFNQGYGLGEIGSTKTGSMLDFQYFYQPLSEGKNLGEAFKDWFTYITGNGVDFDELCWHYGMTLLADPFLKPTGHSGAIAEDRERTAPDPVLVLRENPVRDRIRLRLSIGQPVFISVALYDVQGRKVGEMTDKRFISAPVEIDHQVGTLPNGVYVIRAEVGGKGYEQKVVKLR
jgi:hypothetical protein